jgi:hypothetical protein
MTSKINIPVWAWLVLPVIVGILAGCEINDDDDSSSNGLVIVPVSVSFNASSPTNILFTASGGVPPYKWNVADNSLGSIVSSGTTAIYTSSTNAGRNFVTVMDAESNTVSATVNQL